MKFCLALLAVALLSSSAASASSIKIELDGKDNPANPPFQLFGQGSGTYTLGLGTCVAGTSITTCTLSGTYFGVSGYDTGFTGGTYVFTTTYANGEAVDAVYTGTNVSGHEDDFLPTSFPSDSTSIATLTDTVTGVHLIPFEIDGVPSSGVGFEIQNFFNTSCTGDPTCTVQSVGNTPGSEFQGQIVGFFGFDTSTQLTPTPEPSSVALLGTGALGVAGALRRRVKRAA